VEGISGYERSSPPRELRAQNMGYCSIVWDYIWSEYRRSAVCIIFYTYTQVSIPNVRGQVTILIFDAVVTLYRTLW